MTAVYPHSGVGLLHVFQRSTCRSISGTTNTRKAAGQLTYDIGSAGVPPHMAPPKLGEQRWLGCGLALTSQAAVQEVLQRPVQALVPLLLICALDVCKKIEGFVCRTRLWATLLQLFQYEQVPAVPNGTIAFKAQ